ncbi:hypothetical protein ABZY93_18680 [Streptomyces smyrnaeus]|uniref:hypothetical protein n=1 Tax=Streptomyces smyrnaeus TaxID=1387713 RepID=UPI0033BC212F
MPATIEATALDLDTLIEDLDTRISTDELPEGRAHLEGYSLLCSVVCGSVAIC